MVCELSVSAPWLPVGRSAGSEGANAHTGRAVPAVERTRLTFAVGETRCVAGAGLARSTGTRTTAYATRRQNGRDTPFGRRRCLFVRRPAQSAYQTARTPHLSGEGHGGGMSEEQSPTRAGRWIALLTAVVTLAGAAVSAGLIKANAENGSGPTMNVVPPISVRSTPAPEPKSAPPPSPTSTYGTSWRSDATSLCTTAQD